MEQTYLGLFNKICERPAFWCKLHRVWLSEDDVKRKRCFNKPTFDMIGEHSCYNVILKNPDYLQDEEVINLMINAERKNKKYG